MAIAYLSIQALSLKEITRLFSQIEINSLIKYENVPCWNWKGRKSQNGYGRVCFCSFTTTIHRIMYAWLVGPLPVGQDKGEVHHRCENTSCCNPAHLEFMSRQANTLKSNNRAAINARKTHCSDGHPLTGENLHPGFLRRGQRVCRICRADYARAYFQKNKAAFREWRQQDRAKNPEKYREHDRAYRRRRKAVKSNRRSSNATSD
jgi:hypothetical protein